MAVKKGWIYVGGCSVVLLQPHLVSSHRSFIVRCDVIELSDGLSGRGDSLVFFLFSDMMEVPFWLCAFVNQIIIGEVEAMCEVVSESSATAIIVTASLKEDEREGQGHISACLLHQSATWYCGINTLFYCFLHEWFFVFMICLSMMDGKIEQLVCIKSSVKLGRFTIKTLEMLHEAF
jgi:hypothetical protein